MRGATNGRVVYALFLKQHGRGGVWGERVLYKRSVLLVCMAFVVVLVNRGSNGCD